MQSQELELVTVKSLLDYSFFVPDYQRGYKWGTGQVENLLKDIAEFEIKEGTYKEEKQTWYCLQPLAVKPILNSIVDFEVVEGRAGGKEAFEVIDGQQRLTTLYIILRVLTVEKSELFPVSYQTRKQSKEYLEDLETEPAIGNIDFYFMKKAHETTKKWLADKDDDFKNVLKSKILNNTKFIWYCIDDKTNAREVFTRLNMGKIPLTASELVKAAILNSKNFPDSATAAHEQREIANAWNHVEKGLNNNDFWYFLSITEAKNSRIELLLGLAAENKPGNLLEYYLTELKSKKAVAIWQQISFIYEILNEWYQNKTLYHLVGLSMQVYGAPKLKSLINDYKSKTKKEFINRLLDEARKIQTDNWCEYTYGEDGGIKPLLRLYNIAKVQISNNPAERFSFYKYNTDSWDLEHINPSAEEPPKDKEKSKIWLNAVFPYILDEKLTAKITESLDVADFSTDKWNPLFAEIINQFQTKEKDNNSILNLCLLDSSTNRAIKNDVFPVKRSKIIEAELKKGKFIPLATKQVFMKYFENPPNQFHCWNDTDMNNYKIDIENTLAAFFTTIK